MTHSVRTQSFLQDDIENNFRPRRGREGDPRSRSAGILWRDLSRARPIPITTRLGEDDTVVSRRKAGPLIRRRKREGAVLRRCSTGPRRLGLLSSYDLNARQWRPRRIYNGSRNLREAAAATRGQKNQGSGYAGTKMSLWRQQSVSPWLWILRQRIHVQCGQDSADPSKS